MLRVRDLALSYGGAEPVLENINLEVEKGAFVSLIGPSGSGKTSILRAVTGLQEPLRGDIALDIATPEIGFLFQDDALLPWRTARQNVSLGLRIRGQDAKAAAATADDWLSRLGLVGLGDRFPRQLSGGQRKRVAIAQVLALRPRLLLMDEPFASLDAIVRTRITQDLLDWVDRESLTVLLVTHDLEEAISVSDSVYVLSQGPRAGIRGHHKVTIPRPRNMLESRRHPSFTPLLDRLWGELEDGSVPNEAAPEEAPKEAPKEATA